MIRKDILNTKIYNEFNTDEQELYFSCYKQKYLHNVDTLYYSVFIENDRSNLKNFISDIDFEKLLTSNSNFDLKAIDTCFNIDKFISKLNEFRELSSTLLDDIIYDNLTDLLYKRRRFKIYDHCLSINQKFDIFIASSIPNEKTPRIVVQCRSIGLWLDGPKVTVKNSFDIVRHVLSEFNLNVSKVQENRIDFAYHTNVIQNPMKFFSDKILKDNLKTSFNIYSKVGRKEGNELTVEYLSLGSRRSNNVFFRTYNKTREVIEENYKEFFIELWRKYGLISNYDMFVLEYAYKRKSYSQLSMGKLEFYLKYGKDESTKIYLRDVKKKYNTNLEEVKKRIEDILPEITLVINVEFQTMRKFYYYSDSVIDGLETTTEFGDEKLSRIFKILDNRKIFLDYLTSSTVSFCKNPITNDEDKYMDWWKRLRSLKIKSNSIEPLKRDYSRNMNIERLEQRLKSTLASMNLYLDRADTSLTEDYSSALCVLNDNDIEDVMFVSNDTGEVIELKDNGEYSNIKSKKEKQLKSLLNKNS